MKRVIAGLLLITIGALGIAFAAAKSAGIDIMNLQAVVEELEENAVAYEDEVQVPIQGKGNVVIDAVSSDITFYDTDGDDLQVVLIGSYAASSNYKPPELRVEEKNDFVRVYVKHYPHVGVMMTQHYDMAVYLPKTYQNELAVESVSAEVYMTKRTFDSLEIHTVSGDATLRDVHAERVELTTTSGEFVLDDVVGRLSFKSTSGDIELTLSELKDRVDISTVSGHAILRMPPDPSFHLVFDTVSGDLDMDLNGRVREDDRRFEATVGSGAFNIRIDSVSGDVEVK